MDKMLSVVLPAYNEEQMIKKTSQVVGDLLEKEQIPYELVFVNDGSKDHTWEKILELKEERAHIKGVCFSRNFGKEAAMYAGFCNANADYVCVMDADMQDPPSLLPEMLEILHTQDYDSVATRRKNREGEPPIRSWFAHRFYEIINKISDADIVDGARDFRLMKREMVEAIVSMTEYNRFSKGIFGWIGFKTYWLSYDNIERVAGETKWNFWKLTKYAIDGIINFSQAPLSAVSWFGVLMTVVSFLMLLVVIGRKLIYGDPVAGWASTICVIIFIGGLQLFCLGVIGHYIAKMYLETKQRPHFIISETNDENAVKLK